MTIKFCVLINGSSPWARGTLNTFFRSYLRRRFIPVGTGNTIPNSVDNSLNAVHPRGHGEHNLPEIPDSSAFGSSPWARGTRAPRLYCSARSRFIPVGTGNTPWLPRLPRARSVHPRGHGEHEIQICCNPTTLGSSPWARGTPVSQWGETVPLRFIPVGTGNTSRHTVTVWVLAVHPRGHGEHNF